MLLQSSTAETRMSSLYLTSNIWSFGKFKSIAFPAVESKVDILFPRNSEKIFYHIFISFLFHRERMTKYFISFLFHRSGSNDEIFYHIFISFLFHRERMTKYFITFLFDEIFYFIFISSIRIEWRNILSHFYFILSSPGTNDEIFYHILISFLFHPEQMTKYFISFLFHSRPVGCGSVNNK